MAVFTDLGCGGDGPIIGINDGIDWDWECRIGGGYSSVVGVLDDEMEVSDSSVALSGRNRYGLFFNIFLEFGEGAIGQFFGGRCYLDMLVAETGNWVEMFLEENLSETMLDGRGCSVADY